MPVEVVRKGNLWINGRFLEFLSRTGLRTYEDFFSCGGDPIKAVVKGRTTSRVVFRGCSAYMKRHTFPGIKEILKSILRFRLPKGAMNEWEALLAFHRHGIPTLTPMAAGRRVILGILEKDSFLLTEELKGAKRLDFYLKDCFPNPARGKPAGRKRRILSHLADLTRRMHHAGLNHRDYYLCHVFINVEDESLAIIDLHRVDIRGKVGRRWIIKDLAALLYSSLDSPVTNSERMAFYKRYMEIDRLSSQDKHLIRAILRKSTKIARHTQKMAGGAVCPSAVDGASCR